MKLITAVIQPDKLDQVRKALHDADISRITVSRCTGRGHQAGEDLYRGQPVAPNLIPKVKIDIAVNDEFVDKACNAIIQAAKHGEGEIGDGKIFVTALERCVRIRTGESGSSAI